MSREERERLLRLETRVGAHEVEKNDLYKRVHALERECRSIREISRVGRFRFHMASLFGNAAERLRRQARHARDE